MFPVGASRKIVVVGSYADSLVNFRGPLLQAMVRAGHEVIACAPDGSPELVAELKALGVEYCDIPLERTGLNPVRDLRFLLALYRLFRRIKPEVVLGYTIKPVLYGSYAARAAGVPCLYSLITGLGYAFGAEAWRQRLLGSLVRQLYRHSLRFNRKVFFQNPDNLASFAAFGLLRNPQQAVLVNGSGVDVDAFVPAPLPERPAFLLIARLLGDKGIREYVAAARAVSSDYPEVKFRLAGWLDEKPGSIRQSELDSWQEEGIIEYLGRLADVRPALRAASVYVLPSYAEGTPRTVLEALAMGRAVITTDAPGCRETVVHGENGFLVPVKDVAALAAAMRQFIQHPLLAGQMGVKGRAISEEKYAVDKVNRVMLEAMDLTA